MLMEILRYVIVFFTVGWGGALFFGLQFLVLRFFLQSSSGTDVGRVALALVLAVSTLLAVLLAYYLTAWTGVPPTLAMYALAFVVMALKHRQRVQRAKTRRIVSLEVRKGMILTERLNWAGDLLGFLLGVYLLLPLDII